MPTREVARQHRKSSDFSCVTTSDSQDRAGSKWTAVQHAWEAVPTDVKGPMWRRHGVDLPPGYTAAPFLSVYTLCVLSPMRLEVNAVSAKSSRPRGCGPRPRQTGCKLSGEPATVQSRRQLCSRALGATHPSSNLCPWESSVAIAASVSSFVTRG